MIMSKLDEFSSKTALDTGGTGLKAIGNVIDTTNVRDIANGNQSLYLVIQVDTAVTSGGAATVEFQLASDSQAPVRDDGNQITHMKSGAIAKATLVAGYQAVFRLPLPLPAWKRYLGIVQNVGTAALTAGKINAFLTLDPPVWESNVSAVNA